MKVKSSLGYTPLLYAAINRVDEICMYLSLRVDNIDEPDETGKNTFVIYMLRQDTVRCK